MVNHLSALAGKNRKFIILNGKLVRSNNGYLVVHRDNYNLIFSRVVSGTSVQEITEDEGMGILHEAATQFGAKYPAISSHISQFYNQDASKELLSNFYWTSDSFAGALVAKNSIYDILLDDDNESHFHDGAYQFPNDIRAELTLFIKEFIMDYFEIYYKLLSRKLMGTHMPSKIKGHLVSGLFQPLVVKTKYVDCPMTLGDFQWFHHVLSTPSQCEEYLENVQETSRGLGLSVIAMCDFAERFDVPCVTELSRINFLFIIYSLLMDSIDPGSAAEMVQRFPAIYRDMQRNRSDSVKALNFFTSCIESFNKLRTQIAVR